MLAKAEYYSLLQTTHTTGDWEKWVLFMLEGVEQTAKSTVQMIKNIRDIMLTPKHTFREKLPKIYSGDILNNIFQHPYTKIDFVMRDIRVSRLTATRYLNQLVDIGILEKVKLGRESFYVNRDSYKLIRAGK